MARGAAIKRQHKAGSLPVVRSLCTSPASQVVLQMSEGTSLPALFITGSWTSRPGICLISFFNLLVHDDLLGW